MFLFFSPIAGASSCSYRFIITSVIVSFHLALSFPTSFCWESVLELCVSNVRPLYKGYSIEKILTVSHLPQVWIGNETFVWEDRHIRTDLFTRRRIYEKRSLDSKIPCDSLSSDWYQWRDPGLSTTRKYEGLFVHKLTLIHIVLRISSSNIHTPSFLSWPLLVMIPIHIIALLWSSLSQLLKDYSDH